MKKNVKKVDKNEELKELKKKLFYKKENVFENISDALNRAKEISE